MQLLVGGEMTVRVPEMEAVVDRLNDVLKGIQCRPSVAGAYR